MTGLVSTLKRFLARQKNNYLWCFAFSSLILIFIYFIYQPEANLNVSLDDHEEDVQNIFERQQEQNAKNEQEIKRYFLFYNLLGGKASDVTLLENLLKKENDTFRNLVWSRTARARELKQNVQEKSPNSLTIGHVQRENGLKVNIATVACGSKSTLDVMVMLKSVVMFSRDVDLHIIIFGDRTLPLLAELILELKWTVNKLGYDFTYEISMVWFPRDRNEEWKQMYALCATQRLFFPSLLPHIDSLIYLDADSILVSNLTNFWLQFKSFNESQIAGIAPNTEWPANGFYNKWSKVPYYGRRGLNAGILMMNLTRMRYFDFENKALAAYTVYKEKVQMADQDILNILFAAFPEKLRLIDCTYNFIWAHCGEDIHIHQRVCLNEKREGPICFCHASLQNGIHVVHGNMGSFHKPDYPLFKNLYAAMSQFNLLSDSYTEFMSKLISDFNALDRPCFYLTGEKMYENAKTYFHNFNLIT